MAPADSSPWRVFFLNYLSSDEHFETCAKNLRSQMVKCLTVPCCGVKVPKNTRCRRPTGKTGNLISKHTGHVWVGPQPICGKNVARKNLWKFHRSWAVGEVHFWKCVRVKRHAFGCLHPVPVSWNLASSVNEGFLADRSICCQIREGLHLTYEIGLKDVEILHNEFSQLLSQPRSICFWKRASSSIQSPIV